MKENFKTPFYIFIAVIIAVQSTMLYLNRKPTEPLPAVSPTGELTEEELVLAEEPETIYVSCGSNLKFIDGIPVNLNNVTEISIGTNNNLIFNFTSEDYKYGEIEYMNRKQARERIREIIREQNNNKEEI